METRIKASDLLTREEIRALTQRSDWAGVWAVASTWMVIAACFAVLARWPSVPVFVGVVLVLGGRQLALAILSHEAAHGTLFRTRALNDWLADGLCARPIWNDVARYRQHHMRHHAHTGTDQDPDLSLIAPFPTSRRSLWRKCLRDLSGVTGLRRIVGQFLMDIGVLHYTVAAEVERRPRAGRRMRDYAREGLRNLSGMLLANLALAGALIAVGEGWLYSAWIVAYLTTFSLYLRIRSIAEHAGTERSPHPLRNTRTTRAGWLSRLTVAPFQVNFHREHHLLAAVPFYRLPRMHALLRARGHVEADPPGYLAVLAEVTRAPA